MSKTSNILLPLLSLTPSLCQESFEKQIEEDEKEFDQLVQANKETASQLEQSLSDDPQVAETIKSILENRLGLDYENNMDLNITDETTDAILKEILNATNFSTDALNGSSSDWDFLTNAANDGKQYVSHEQYEQFLTMVRSESSYTDNVFELLDQVSQLEDLMFQRQQIAEQNQRQKTEKEIAMDNELSTQYSAISEMITTITGESYENPHIRRDAMEACIQMSLARLDGRGGSARADLAKVANKEMPQDEAAQTKLYQWAVVCAFSIDAHDMTLYKAGKLRQVPLEMTTDELIDATDITSAIRVTENATDKQNMTAEFLVANLDVWQWAKIIRYSKTALDKLAAVKEASQIEVSVILTTLCLGLLIISITFLSFRFYQMDNEKRLLIAAKKMKKMSKQDAKMKHAQACVLKQ